MTWNPNRTEPVVDEIYLGNTLAQWLTAAAIFIVSALALWATGKFVLARFAIFAGRTETGLDDLVAGVLGRTKALLVMIIAAFFASVWLTVEPHIALVMRRAAAIAIVIQCGIWAGAAITHWVDAFVERTADEDPGAVTTVSALSFVGRLAVWVIVLLLILDNLGVEVTALLTGLGIGGIAVALAVKDVLGDLLASLSIVLDKPFVIGDFLVVGHHHYCFLTFCVKFS